MLNVSPLLSDLPTVSLCELVSPLVNVSSVAKVTIFPANFPIAPPIYAPARVPAPGITEPAKPPTAVPTAP